MTEQSPELNIFKILGITKNENIHSEFLAWLLSPYENHGLGSKIFTKIIEKLKNCGNCGNCEALNAIKIDNDLPYLKVTREFSYNNNNNENSDCGRFDILIRNSVGDNKFFCLIENKIESRRDYNQLEKYKEFLDKWEKYKKLYLFLSPKNGKCEWDNKNGYININYELIKEVIKEVIKDVLKEKEIEDDKIKSIIKQYLDIIPTTMNEYNIENNEIKINVNNNEYVFKKNNQYEEYLCEPKDENKKYKNYYYTITDGKLGICIRPKDKNPNIELIEKFEEEYKWEEKVYINRSGYYWVFKDLNNINDINDIIDKTTKIFESPNTNNPNEQKIYPSFCPTNSTINHI